MIADASAPRPRVSVAVCTRNRSGVLGGCLESLSTQTVDPATMEVVVVDNGSTDATAHVVTRYQERMNLRYLREPTPGLSRARNLALEHAAGPIVAFLDDDARATPGWLAALLDAFENDGVVAAGGPVVISWPARSPRWVSPAIERWFSGLHLGPAARALSDGEEVFGCNLAVRRDIARGVGGFAVHLGRVGRRLRSGEDRQFLDLVRQAGDDVLYVPDAVVVHEVLPERLHLTWPLRRAYEQGRSDAQRTRRDASAGVLRSDARSAATKALRGLRGETRRWVTNGRSPSEAVVMLMRRAVLVGYARECLRLATDTRRGSRRVGDTQRGAL